MALYIEDSCIHCGTCEIQCPVHVISEPDIRVIIDENVCINCGICIKACPLGAIKQI